MNVEEQIRQYIYSQPEPKQTDMNVLHQLTLQLLPACKLWFLDGKDDKGQTVSNPSIGYASHTIKYADGTSKEFYKVGLSANKSGLSIYILGITDKAYLAEMYGNKIGKASVSGYCSKFKRPSV